MKTGLLLDKIIFLTGGSTGTWTPMRRKWCAVQPNPSSIERYLDEIHPLGYCPEGNAIADACVYFLSDKARFVTGHIKHVSGGAEISYRRPLENFPC